MSALPISSLVGRKVCSVTECIVTPFTYLYCDSDRMWCCATFLNDIKGVGSYSILTPFVDFFHDLSFVCGFLEAET